MTKSLQVYKFIGFLSAVVYTILGIIILGSILNGTTGLYINMIMGLAFTAIGCYIYAKTQSVIALVTHIQNSNNREPFPLKTYNRFLLFEILFSGVTLLLGFILLSAAIFRTFGEHLPIFG